MDAGQNFGYYGPVKTMKATIRKAVADDATPVAQLWQALLHHHLPYSPCFEIADNAAIGFSDHLRKLPDNPAGLLLVAEMEVRLVGFLHGSILNRPPCFTIPRQGQIWDLFVLEPFRHQGVARELVNRAMEFFREKGIRFVDVRIATRNEAALAFWKKMGLDPYITVGKLEPC